jgi:beta-mannosidase
MQPNDSLHLDNIRKEAEYNVKRLRNHPSVALWCGNNENLIAWFTWNWKDRFEPEISEALWGVYQKIYYDILPGAVQKYHPEISYWPSSPQAYGDKLADRKSGDEHDWKVWFAEAPFSAYTENVPRFVSEYGMQSFPEMKTILAFANDSDLAYRSPVMDHRQRSNLNWIGPGVNGNEMIMRYIKRYYHEPRDFNSYIYLGQLMHAEGMRVAIESHRRYMPTCMGSLYWQINDCWPTMSWAGVDYFGRWKALHYFVREAFKPLMVIPYAEEGNFYLSIVNDQLKDTSAVLEIRLFDYKGKEVWKDDRDVKIKSNSSKIFYSLPVKDIISGGNPAQLVLEASLKAGDQILASNNYYFADPKELNLEKPAVERTIVKKNAEEYEITLRTNTLVKNLALSTKVSEGFFSNNYFDMIPGRTYTVTFSGDGKNLEQDLVLQYVNDSF